MTYRKTLTTNALDLAIGDIVHFYGSRFLIVECERQPVTHKPLFDGEVIARNIGRWIDGEPIQGYFGPGCRDWNFQGNQNATFAVEVVRDVVAEQDAARDAMQLADEQAWANRTDR